MNQKINLKNEFCLQILLYRCMVAMCGGQSVVSEVWKIFWTAEDCMSFQGQTQPNLPVIRFFLLN